MSLVQDMATECLEMECGTRKEETDKVHVGTGSDSSQSDLPWSEKKIKRWNYKGYESRIKQLFVKQKQEFNEISNIEESAYFNRRTYAWMFDLPFTAWTIIFMEINTCYMQVNALNKETDWT